MNRFKETLLCLILMGLGAMINLSVLMVLAMVIGGYKQAIKGFADMIEHRRLNAELLMMIAALGSSAIGYYFEGALLIFIFSLSGSLEELSMDKSQKDIASLLRQQPAEAVRITENKNFETIEYTQLNRGDHVLIAAGEIVPIDGIVVEGTSELDEATITGESHPNVKSPADLVFGGTLNISQPIIIKATTTADDTVLQQIVRMVEQAQKYPSRTGQIIAKLEDVYARIVVLAVITTIVGLMFLLGYSFEQAFYRGMILLVVSSPCALVASVTPATLAAISYGTRQGILVKGGIHFENIADIQAVCFDKTGTLTEGNLILSDFFFVNDDSKHMSACYSLEQYSTHPLARSVVKGLSEKINTNVQSPVLGISERPGHGIEGEFEGNLYFVGKLQPNWTNDPSVISKTVPWQDQGKNVVFAYKDECLIGAFGLADRLREEAREVIGFFNDQGIETIMITGDSGKNAHYIGEKLQIKSVIAQCLPHQKSVEISKLIQENKTVMMLGDGINDAPALAMATVGVAMGKGSDIAIETADVILMNSRLASICEAHRLSLRLRKIITQNIIFSLSIIIALVVANFWLHISIPLGVVGHEGSTILVILNGLRLLRK